MTNAQFYFGLGVPLVGILVSVVLFMTLGRRAERVEDAVERCLGLTENDLRQFYRDLGDRDKRTTRLEDRGKQAPPERVSPRESGACGSSPLGRHAERPLPIYENRTQIRLGRTAQRRWPAAIQSAALRLRRHDAEASDPQCPSLRETRGA
jgi:hypothetical protein